MSTKHALIRWRSYAHYYQNKVDDVINMLRTIKAIDETKQKELKAEHKDSTNATSMGPKPGTLWTWRNKSGLNPLELATKFGLCDIFVMIYNSEPYFIEQSNDGLKDIKKFDITDLDPIVHDASDSGSILNFLFEINPSKAMPFIRTPQISKIIEEKWSHYRRRVYIWFFLHLAFMSFLTWYAIESSEQNFNNETQFNVDALPSYRNLDTEEKKRVQVGYRNSKYNMDLGEKPKTESLQ
ncbi:hypothetical protein MAR_023859 [Mya arenaria]|uniref:Uncharacterized protein n=1 Tax=Mya arenaria TaxID=6604 RepID=A0ABY7DSA4_MYAAR|nr:hypothetical protein MAR_023859 [Mya arenaria]